MPNPYINANQIAIDPIDGIFFFKDSNGSLVSSSLNLLQTSNTLVTAEDNIKISGNKKDLISALSALSDIKL